MDIPIIFTSSMPRSGSTLLQNLLAQNPKHHCTSTNDLLDLLIRVRDHWMTSVGFMAQGLKNIEPRIRSMMKGAIHGFYEGEFAAGKIVFDKSRGWISHIELIEKVLERPVKMIVTVRDVRDILASFEKIHRKSVLTDHPVAGPEQFQKLTVQGRAERLLSIEKTVGYTINCIQDAFDRKLDDRLVIVPYKELTHHPVETIWRVCDECGIEPFACDPDNVPQATQEDDTVYGMDLHTTHPKVTPDFGGSWIGVLPEPFADFVNSQLPVIQGLANRRYIQADQSVRLASIAS